MVTNDGTTQYYAGGGRNLSFQYDGLLQAMEAPPAPPRSAEEQARITAAEAVLFDPETGDDTTTYARYQRNQAAYAEARAAKAAAEIAILSDPDRAGSAPVLLQPLAVKLNQAFNKWKTQGADEIEEALATLQSLGIPMEQGMIQRARELHESWLVDYPGLSGLSGAKEPYTYVDPSQWAEIDANDIGWTTLEHQSRTYTSHFEQHGYNLHTGAWGGSSQNTSGTAGVSVFGFGFSGTYGEWGSQSHSNFTDTGSDGTVLRDDATDLSIRLEYGLCEIRRPWLVTDLFQMQNWYLRGERKGAISSGTVDDQVGNTDKKLPMIPTAFLVIRNVRITTSNWGSTRDTLQTYWHANGRSDRSEGSSVSGGVSIPVWGPISIGGGYSHSEQEYGGDFRDEGGNDVRNDFGAHFEGDTLVINGAQVVGLLGEIIPMCPPMDDPALVDDNQ
ncbi:hypothetical protein C5E43_26285 [Nocardia cyriacigeorgica]|nr:hypothetical protein C5E43_26285 [Nocardia cyriacigeorgica]